MKTKIGIITVGRIMHIPIGYMTQQNLSNVIHSAKERMRLYPLLSQNLGYYYVTSTFLSHSKNNKILVSNTSLLICIFLDQSYIFTRKDYTKFMRSIWCIATTNWTVHFAKFQICCQPTLELNCVLGFHENQIKFNLPTLVMF